MKVIKVITYSRWVSADFAYLQNIKKLYWPSRLFFGIELVCIVKPPCIGKLKVLEQ